MPSNEWRRTFDTIPDMITIVDNDTPHRTRQPGHMAATRLRMA